jgi:hypothetical protein
MGFRAALRSKEGRGDWRIKKVVGSPWPCLFFSFVEKRRQERATRFSLDRKPERSGEPLFFKEL